MDLFYQSELLLNREIDLDIRKDYNELDVMDLENGRIYKELGTNCIKEIIKK
jgi:hypothetical protein